MAKKKGKKKASSPKDYVVVSNPSYGKALKGKKIYFEGSKPPQLQKDGRIKFGKHILETLTAKYQTSVGSSRARQIRLRRSTE